MADKTVNQKKREITIHTTVGTGGKYETDVTTWGELQGFLNTKNIPFNKMKAVMGHNKLTLESSDAVLPESDFTVFLMPKKTKSGMVDDVDDAPYKVIRAEISAITKGEHSAKAIKHFNKDKNYTTKSTAILKKLLKSWYKKGLVTNVADVVESVKASKTKKAPVEKKKTVAKEKVKEEVEDAVTPILNQAKEMLQSVGSHVNVTDAVEAVDEVIAAYKDEDRKGMSRAEKKSLDQQAKAIATSFGDVR